MIRNVLICTTQVPFTRGGAEDHVEGLRRALVAAGHATEVVALPFKWYPPMEIMRGAMALRMLDGAAAVVAGGDATEVVALPYKWYPPMEIMRGAMAWRMLDVSAANGQAVDLVIGMKFPAYLVAHPNKVLWILHQHRSAYNLWGTEFDDLSTFPEGPHVRDWIKHCDEQLIPEAEKVFDNSRTIAHRLKIDNKLDSD